jgi:hypothetical protein
MAAQLFLRLIQQLAFVSLVGALTTLLQHRPHNLPGTSGSWVSPLQPCYQSLLAQGMIPRRYLPTPREINGAIRIRKVWKVALARPINATIVAALRMAG